MFDQTFSAKNIEVIFNVENRKGHVDLSRMPQPYRDVVAEVKACRTDLKQFSTKKRKDWSDAEHQDYEQKKEQLKQLLEKKDEVLQRIFEEIEVNINKPSFSFLLTAYDYGKQCFTIDGSDWKQFYAMKILQRNLARLFNVEMPNRHTVMVNLKLLLNTKMPFYIIRTDVKSFFESIPHDELFRLVERNSMLNTKTKSMVKKVFLDYEHQKDTARVPAGQGVPRGIGISSPLSEIYMNPLDKQIRERQEVIFYARYVDDIFIVLSSLGAEKSLNDYYNSLQATFLAKGLTLQPIDSAKCKLVSEYGNTNAQAKSVDLTYLGYHLYMTKTKGLVTTSFGLSDTRKNKLKERIDHIFSHFANMVKVSPSQARRDLQDGLNLISGNIRLSKAKSGVKVGFYYNNDLLDRDADFAEIQNYLNSKTPSIPANLFANPADKTKYEARLTNIIQGIDFKDRWTQHKMFDLGLERVKSIERWL